jgi:hypothetical protein
MTSSREEAGAEGASAPEGSMALSPPDEPTAPSSASGLEEKKFTNLQNYLCILNPAIYLSCMCCCILPMICTEQDSLTLGATEAVLVRKNCCCHQTTTRSYEHLDYVEHTKCCCWACHCVNSGLTGVPPCFQARRHHRGTTVLSPWPHRAIMASPSLFSCPSAQAAGAQRTRCARGFV